MRSLPSTENPIIIKTVFKNQQIEIDILDTATDDCYISPQKLIKPSEAKYAAILYNIQPAALELKKIGQHTQFYKIREPFMLFLPRKTSAQFIVHPEAFIKAIEIKYFEKEDVLSELSLQQCPLAAIRRLEDLFSLCLEQVPDVNQIIDLHNDILKLCTSGTSNAAQLNKSGSLHYDKMLAVKKLIEEKVKTELPALPELAQQFSMTVSTLKRQFKIHFGSGIYHYYLQKKMEAALKLLQEEKHTVNETAELLGYASVSNFIETFRKFYGNSPGNYKKGSC